MSAKQRIGFIGLGIMGQSMAGHLLAAGHQLNVFNRSKSKTDDLVAKGAKWFDTIGDLAAESDVIITMVGYPSDVEEVYFGAGKILDRAKNAYLIDMTTSSPSLAKRIAEEAEKRGCHGLDAPVSGGDVGARNAKLSIMVGGKQSDFDAVLPILKIMGSNVVLQGGPGAGQHTKMCNQIVIAGTIMGVSEGLGYAKSVGLNPETVMESIGGGAASGFQLLNLGARMIAGDFAPGFYVEHFLKDLGIALEEAQKVNLDLPALALAKKLYEGLVAEGCAKNGTQVLFTKYAR
ncbi:NAD(P)-dependent oxidoreductase [Polynucleobacter sp. MWH-Braz-FAM2G]|uniref:NAD(P)-dependent oxidoreductase n=1 Tax=Polynucleobacter sp. MWH-Braz-FAM2G TaxID=1855883 RepID=UPI001BFD8A93|nr:NAD(P)-dependent oxidoreductase [Polynucleobacter sp. MWH-Braz-FAM2G]QWD90086.1 NAD(P)-dependent oxidoreductase [Polynucleobacter sp. MWH-Braz-FAM2G]